MQPGEISSEPADEALHFDQLPLGPSIGQSRQIPGVFERNPYVERVTAYLDLHRSLCVGSDQFNGFVRDRTSL